MLSLSARGEEVLILMLLSSPLSCSRDTMPPAALWLSSLNTQKPPSWMYLFETSIFKSWRCSVIKQNCFEENSYWCWCVWCKHMNVAVSMLMCAFDHTKQMLCSNEMAERLSWISWGAVYQGSALLLSCHSMCGLTSRKQLLWVTVHTCLCNFSSLLPISCDPSTVMWAE